MLKQLVLAAGVVAVLSANAQANPRWGHATSPITTEWASPQDDNMGSDGSIWVPFGCINGQCLLGDHRLLFHSKAACAKWVADWKRDEPNLPFDHRCFGKPDWRE
jgi:hypothetical protein